MLPTFRKHMPLPSSWLKWVGLLFIDFCPTESRRKLGEGSCARPGIVLAVVFYAVVPCSLVNVYRYLEWKGDTRILPPSSVAKIVTLVP